MNSRPAAGCVLLTMAVCVLSLQGCGMRTPKPAPRRTAHSESTIERVFSIVSEQLNVDRSKLNANTSLGDLGADDLDFVELVMELEEEFDITIPDDTAEQMMGGKDGAEGLKQVSIAKLAATVEERLGHRTQDAQQAAPATGSVPGDQAPQPVR